MAKHMEKCSDCGAEFEVLFEPRLRSAPVSPFYCSDCFPRNYDVTDVSYITNFVAFLSEKFNLTKGSKIVVARAKGFIYQFLLEEGSGDPRFLCTIELKRAGIAEPISKFTVVFSTLKTGIQDISSMMTFIGQFIRKYGNEADAHIISPRRF